MKARLWRAGMTAVVRPTPAHVPMPDDCCARLAHRPPNPLHSYPSTESGHPQAEGDVAGMGNDGSAADTAPAEWWPLGAAVQVISGTGLYGQGRIGS